MTVTPPTRQQMHELAARRTAELGYPQDPPTDGRSVELYHQQRDALYARQLRNAESELTRRFERERDAEQQAAARLRAQADEREATLRDRFNQRFPGGSDADYQALRPALLAELSAEAAQVDQDALRLARRRISI